MKPEMPLSRLPRLFLCLLFMNLCFVLSNAGAETATKSNCVEGDCFDSQATISGQAIPLRGAAIFRVLNNDLYTSAFYVSSEARTTDEVLGDVPKRLVIHCRRDFQKEDMIKAAEKNLKSNPTLDIEKLEPQINQLSKHMDPAKQGDEYALTYIPGKGTQFEFNGQIKVIIPGADFAHAFFGIWVSPYSISQKLRLQLLSFTGSPAI